MLENLLNGAIEGTIFVKKSWVAFFWYTLYRVSTAMTVSDILTILTKSWQKKGWYPDIFSENNQVKKCYSMYIHHFQQPWTIPSLDYNNSQISCPERLLRMINNNDQLSPLLLLIDDIRHLTLRVYIPHFHPLFTEFKNLSPLAHN